MAASGETLGKPRRETLARLEDRGLVDRRASAGEHGADVYHGDDVADALVDLGGDQTANDHLLVSCQSSIDG